jgi:hypothetical protein
MGKRKADQVNSPAEPIDIAASSEPAKLETPSIEAALPAESAAKIEASDSAPASEKVVEIEAPDFVPSTPSAAPADAVAPSAVPPPVAAVEAPAAEATSSAQSASQPPQTLPATVIPFRDDAEASEPAGSNTSTSWAWLKMPGVTPLAASIAIAAVAGAMAGSVATAGFGGLWASPAPVSKTADVRPLRDTITHLNDELAALKASIENSGRTTTAQFSRLGDRLDRVEHAQAEPAAKLTKLAEAVDRMEHRAPASVATSHEVTGSISAPPQPSQPATVAPVRPIGPPIIDGWIVRSVYNGAALIQARYGGLIEVEPGDSLPGLGRIENIHRKDGRWVVVTSKGMIVAR